MKIGVLAETAEGEKRVAVTPEGVKALIGKGFEVQVQNGAGVAAGFLDSAYKEAGAIVSPNPEVEMLLRVSGPSDSNPKTEVGGLAKGGVLVSFLFPSSNPKSVQRLAEQDVTAFAMDLIPRITRAQRMDALSSMSTIAGYRGALLAAEHLPKFFPMFMTAAGTLPPARVLVIGAGVAGLQAIATCKRLGAVIEAFDVRPAVKEQVESLGARFVDMPLVMEDAEDASGYAKEVTGDTHQRELEVIGKRMAKCDVVITTALIPGKPAPILITREMVSLMAPGSVIVDLAATNGGNCEATAPGSVIQVDGVTLVGSTSLLSDMAGDASRMYSRNITEFVLNLAPEGKLQLDLEDPIVHGTLVTHEGKVVHEPTRLALEKP